MNISNQLASELDFSTNRFLSEEFADEYWDTKFGEAWQECFK
jgi:hypothetical protein